MARILGTTIVGLNAKCCRVFQKCVPRYEYDQLWSSPAAFKAVCMILFVFAAKKFVKAIFSMSPPTQSLNKMSSNYHDTGICQLEIAEDSWILLCLHFN